MIVPGAANPFGVVPSGVDIGDNIPYSLMLNSGLSQYLSRTFAAGDRNKWTAQFTFKRGKMGIYGALLGGGGSGTSYDEIRIDVDDALYIVFQNTVAGAIKTSRLFRDPMAEYDVAVAVDTTQATAANRVKIWVNGVQETSFSTASYPAQNYQTFINSATTHGVGAASLATYTDFFDGVISRAHFIGGQQLDASSFGRFSVDVPNFWVPKNYTGTYGTNGFKLDFTNGAALGTDVSGNGNNWTLNGGITSANQLTDTPSTNYCILNPLDKDISRGTVDTYNSRIFYNPYNTVNAAAVRGSIGVSSGRVYLESKNVTWNGAGNAAPLVFSSDTRMLTGVSAFAGTLGGYIGATPSVYANSVIFSTNGVSASLANGSILFATYTSGDVISIAVDFDAGKIWVAKNGVWYGSGDPASGTNPTATFTPAGAIFFPIAEAVTSSDNVNQSSNSVNFGQRPFTYTPPSGFKALCAANLPEPSILVSKKHSDVKTYLAAAAGGSVTGCLFQPDFVLGKNRPTVENWYAIDSVRGGNNLLATNTTAAEASNANLITAWNSDGYTYGNALHAASTYVDYLFKAGGAAVSNTDGSITSQVSANKAAGFSIVTWTGTGANATVGHGLGVAPMMVIVKTRNGAGTENWVVYRRDWNANNYVLLNTTGAQGTDATAWNNTHATSTIFSVGANTNTNQSGKLQVAYCFAEVPGYSKIGSYTGNGSADGPFVACGFKPRFVLIKRFDAGAENWQILDSARNTYNPESALVQANTTAAEASVTVADFVANGFKVRFNTGDFNTLSATYIFLAIGDPFKYSNAR